MTRQTCHFSGHVQGVGFRYTAQNIALRFDVTGYVRNLADGRVELVVEGAEPEVEKLLAAIQQKMDGFIKKVNSQSSPATGEFAGFSVRH